MRIVCHKTHVMTRTPRNVLQPWSFIQKQNQKSPYQTVSHYCRYLPHTNILNRIPRRCPRKLPTNLSLWTATSWRGRICCTAVTQTKSRDWYWRRLFLLPDYGTRTFRCLTDGTFSDATRKQISPSDTWTEHRFFPTSLRLKELFLGEGSLLKLSARTSGLVSRRS